MKVMTAVGINKAGDALVLEHNALMTSHIQLTINYNSLLKLSKMQATLNEVTNKALLNMVKEIREINEKLL